MYCCLDKDAWPFPLESGEDMLARAILESGATMISAEQVRAARGWLGWSQAELSSVSGISRRTIVGIENGTRISHDRTLVDLRRTFEACGIEFLFSDGGRPTGVRVLHP